MNTRNRSKLRTVMSGATESSVARGAEIVGGHREVEGGARPEAATGGGPTLTEKDFLFREPI